MDNAADPKQVRRKRIAAKVADRQVDEFIVAAMGVSQGRAFFYRLLSMCKVYQSNFSPHGLIMSYNEGHRNVGLYVTDYLMRLTPDQYVTMLKENYYARSDADLDTDPGEPVSDVGYPRTQPDDNRPEADVGAEGGAEGG